MYSRSLNNDSHVLNPRDPVVLPRRRQRHSTRGSQDSGIDSGLSTTNNESVGERLEEEEDYLLFRKNRKLQIDDVLWFICLGIMLLVFKLPYKLWFDHRVNWPFLYACFASLILFHIIGLYIRLAIIFKKNPNKNLLKPIAIVCFIISGLLFIISTWQLYQFWSIFMVFVITMSYISAISIA